MKLLEVVSGPDTRDGLVDAFAVFAREVLGKGVVYAKTRRPSSPIEWGHSA